MSTRISRTDLARRIAADIPEGSVVNLGIGAPTLVANYLPDDTEVVLHTENGMLGMGPAPEPGTVDPDLINAGKQPVTALKGAAYFHHADSFAMMRGGHLDVCVLGAFQVSENGDLANWSTGEPGAIPAVGGAMDLARSSARSVIRARSPARALGASLSDSSARSRVWSGGSLASTVPIIWALNWSS
ncbi:CoA-transferase [Streptomyces aquilus]